MIRLKNRWIYGSCAAMCGGMLGLLYCLFLTLGNSSSGDTFSNSIDAFNMFFLMGSVPAGISGLLCWPTFSQRTSRRMIWAGLLTVLIGLLFLGGAIGFYLDENVIEWALIIAVLGTLFTMGIPYVLGAYISRAFAEI